MNASKTIELIKESFENWYNKYISQDSPVTVLINYSDTQKLSIKAYHTINLEMLALGTQEDTAVLATLFNLTDTYNHGVINEEEAKDGMIKKLLECLYGFRDRQIK